MKARAVEVKIKAKTDSYERAMAKATKAAEKLRNALEEINNTEIQINVVRINKNWWEFWK